MAESDEALLVRWRELLTTIRGYDGQSLDPVDRQTLNELRAALAPFRARALTTGRTKK